MSAKGKELRADLQDESTFGNQVEEQYLAKKAEKEWPAMLEENQESSLFWKLRDKSVVKWRVWSPPNNWSG